MTSEALLTPHPGPPPQGGGRMSGRLDLARPPPPLPPNRPVGPPHASCRQASSLVGKPRSARMRSTSCITPAITPALMVTLRYSIRHAHRFTSKESVARLAWTYHGHSPRR